MEHRGVAALRVLHRAAGTRRGFRTHQVLSPADRQHRTRSGRGLLGAPRPKPITSHTRLPRDTVAASGTVPPRRTVCDGGSGTELPMKPLRCARVDRGAPEHRVRRPGGQNWIEHQTGWSIKKFVQTLRRYRTVTPRRQPHPPCGTFRVRCKSTGLLDGDATRRRCPVHSLEIHSLEVDFARPAPHLTKRGFTVTLLSRKKKGPILNIGQPAKSAAILLVEQLETEFRSF